MCSALLDFGFDFPLGSERSFGFQSNLLAVAIFRRHRLGLRGLERRQSGWRTSIPSSHAVVRLGGAGERSSADGAERVIARTDITVVSMRINRIELGMPLENGPDELVEREFERLLSA